MVVGRAVCGHSDEGPGPREVEDGEAMSLKQVSDVSSKTGRETAFAPTDWTALMAMASQEIETWVEALAHYDNNEFEESLKTFDAIADTSRIHFNCGVIHATLGEHQKAVSSRPRPCGRASSARKPD